MHEWLRYRDRHVKREVVPPAEQPEASAAPSPEAEPEQEAPAQPLFPVEAEAETPVAVEEEPVVETSAPPPAPVGAPRPAAARVPALPGDLRASEFQSRRLQTLLVRQQRLPLEIEEAERPARRGNLPARESREGLIERLLDPVLSIEETSTLLGVCPTSVRRYTNRGVLKCFRTPGNQRRFHLSEVLDFMEKQQSSELD